jgi:hypothetical protein
MNTNSTVVPYNTAGILAFEALTAIAERLWRTAKQATAPLATGETVKEWYENKHYWRTFRVSDTKTATVGYDYKTKQIITSIIGGNEDE